MSDSTTYGKLTKGCNAYYGETLKSDSLVNQHRVQVRQVINLLKKGYDVYYGNGWVKINGEIFNGFRKPQIEALKGEIENGK